MLVFSIIVMLPYLYSMCLVCRVFKSTYFKEHPWLIASKYGICDTGNLNYVQCLNLALMEKASFLALMEYTPLVYSPSGKDKFLWKILFEVVMVKVRDERKYNKKMHCQQKLVLCIIWPVIRACNKIVKI